LWKEERPEFHRAGARGKVNHQASSRKRTCGEKQPQCTQGSDKKKKVAPPQLEPHLSGENQSHLKRKKNRTHVRGRP